MILSAVDVTGWYSMLPFFVALGVAFVAAILATPRLEIRPAEVGFAGAATLGWAMTAAWAPQSAQVGGDAGTLAAYLPAAAVTAGLALVLVAIRSALKEP